MSSADDSRDSEDNSDDWDFYPCRVDDQAASIFLNLRYEREEPPARADTLYWLRIHMKDADHHGMGSSAEADVLFPVEDTLVERAAAQELVYVARLRSHGRWELTFYGPSNCASALSVVAGETELDGRQFEVLSQPDGRWGYYRDFLLPDDERRQWMQDRRVVDVLQDHGDRLSTPRRVDHWIYFRSSESRQAFIEAATPLGFALQGSSDHDDSARPFGVQMFRTDAVDLEHIHSVVMELFALAQRHTGDYDGWECPVEADE
ncbi:MAG: DUF695 domain-containing protein [Kofleriaceae bacterium]|nr:DUF695 domain-containing protein [Kofleriaceae bacterium]